MTTFKKRCLIYAMAGFCVLPQIGMAATKDASDNKAITKVEDKKPNLAEQKNSKKEAPKKVRVLETQTGKLLDSALGDIDGDGDVEEINLMGSSIVNKSSFQGDIYLITKDPKTGKIKEYFRPDKLGGYNPYLTLGDVTGNGIDNVLITADTGGSGGIIDYRIVDFTGDKAEEIFNAADNSGISMTGSYLADYRAELRFPTVDKRIQLDLVGDSDMYRHLNIYDADGNVKVSGANPYVQNLTNLLLLDLDNDGVDEIVTTQRVIGGINSNSLGNVVTSWKYQAKTWQPLKIQFQTNLYSKNNYNRDNKIIGGGGYAINKIELAVDNSAISYPHFYKMGSKKQQWTLNSQIENFVGNEIKSVANVGRVDINYELKYLGRNYASVLLQEVKAVNGKDKKINKAFNFDMKTGENQDLSFLVAKDNKFWEKVKLESDLQKLSCTKKDVQGFYCDGTAINLILKDNKELIIPLSTVGEYLQKDKFDKIILTKQSNEVKTRKTEKKAEK